MSHTTKIKGVSIHNIAALEAAIKELNEKGIACSLVANVAPRAYFQKQEGLGVADYVINLATCPYDVGLYKQPNGTYEPRTDFWAGHVEKVLGTTASKVGNEDQAKLGKLFQSYAKHATLIEARRSGKNVRVIENKETGAIKLVLSGF